MKFKSNYTKTYKLPRKYKFIKNTISDILKLIETDRKKFKTITDLPLNIIVSNPYDKAYYKISNDKKLSEIVFECLKNHFDINVLVGYENPTKFIAIDINKRSNDFASFCLENYLECCKSTYYLWISLINKSRNFYQFKDIRLHTMLPDCVIEHVCNKLDKDYFKDHGVKGINIEHCYSPKDSNYYHKIVNLNFSQINPAFASNVEEVSGTEKMEKMQICLTKVVHAFIKSFKRDEKNFPNHKETIIDGGFNKICLDPEKELNMIKYLLLRKGYELRLNNRYKKLLDTTILGNEYYNYKITIKRIEDDNRIKEIAEMSRISKKYGYKIEKFDNNMISVNENLLSKNIEDFVTEGDRLLNSTGELRDDVI